MKKLGLVSGLIGFCALGAGLAHAEPTLPPAAAGAEPAGAAGAADQGAEERYLSGPGGGEVFDPNGPPPLESTGLEDGMNGGCKCDLALGARAGATSPALGLALLVLGLVSRRRATTHARE